MRAAFVALLALLAVAPAGQAQGKPRAPSSDGSWIVVYERAAVADVDRETDARERRRGFRSRLRFRRAIEGFAARLSAEQVRALRADPDVEAVVPDRPVRALAFQPLAPGEPLPPTGVRRIGAGRADFVRGASEVGVAVVDSGIDLEHPDLNVADGTDCITPGTSADDGNGHGTHVAGTVGALNNGSGVTGVTPGTKVHAVRVLNNMGTGADSSVICGIDWVIVNAAARNIKVLNLSLGALGENNRNCGRRSSDNALVDPLHDAVCRATAAGILNVAAAGNGDPETGIGWDISENPPDVPASYPEVLTVTALADSDGANGGTGATCAGETDETPATFSNFTRSPEEAVHTIAAPGVCIRSTWPLDKAPAGGYRTISGTSMAAPHATALAALCIGEAGAAGPCAGMTPAQIVQRLRADAEAFRTARTDMGFQGDPAAPLPDGRFYGFLARAPGPDTSLSSVPSDPTEDPTPTFAFSSPGAEGFECRVDAGAWSGCASPHTTGELADGGHQFSVRAVDRAGTPDPTPAVDSFTVDRADPPPPPPPPPPEPPPDVTAPLVSLSVATRQRIGTVSRNGIRVAVTCSEVCRLAASVILGGSTAGRKNGGLATGRRVLTIKLTSAVRRRLARLRSVLVRVQVVATDAAGNERTVKKSVRLIR